VESDAARAGRILLETGGSLAVAESLTGGMLASRYAVAPSASEWFRGGIVAYSSVVKHTLLEVPHGPVVSEAAAVAMAAHTAKLLQATVSLAITGVGGPDPQDGKDPGTIWVATWPDDLGPPCLLHLSGSPPTICERACDEACRILRERLRA
jgi:nicotinamide-nucleotide amidase